MQAMKRKGFSPKGSIKKIYLYLILIAAISILIYSAFNLLLLPAVKTLAVKRADIIAINTINSAAGKVLKANTVTYDKLITYQKDINGDIIAVTTNAIEVNKLKYDIINETISELNSIKSSELTIPLGNVIGGAIFTNRGPGITVKLMPVGSVNADITSAFTSAGINQTRQQIMLKVKVNITVILSNCNVSQEIDSNLCIAESIIIGKVPNSYTDINGSNSALDKAIISNSN